MITETTTHEVTTHDLDLSEIWADEFARVLDNKYIKNRKRYNTWPPRIEQIIFNPPATIVKWTDGTKTVVKMSEDELERYKLDVVFNECYNAEDAEEKKRDYIEQGVALCIAKKLYGSRGAWTRMLKEKCNEYNR